MRRDPRIAILTSSLGKKESLLSEGLAQFVDVAEKVGRGGGEGRGFVTDTRFIHWMDGYDSPTYQIEMHEIARIRIERIPAIGMRKMEFLDKDNVSLGRFYVSKRFAEEASFCIDRHVQALRNGVARPSSATHNDETPQTNDEMNPELTGLDLLIVIANQLADATDGSRRDAILRFQQMVIDAFNSPSASSAAKKEIAKRGLTENEAAAALTFQTALLFALAQNAPQQTLQELLDVGLMSLVKFSEYSNVDAAPHAKSA